MFSDIFDKFPVFLLIFARFTGMIIFNPVFGRRNIPANVKVAFAFLISVVVSGVTPRIELELYALPGFILSVGLELGMGYCLGLVMNIFLSSILVAADIIDMQLGIGMSRMYDPSVNLSMPVTGSILNAVGLMLLFASNAHITVIRMVAESVRIIPPGSQINLARVGGVVATTFGLALILALKLAIPIIAIELLSEVGLGILTKAVPNINIFSVGIQLKLLTGLYMLFAVVPFFGAFLDKLFETVYTSTAEVLGILASG